MRGIVYLCEQQWKPQSEDYHPVSVVYDGIYLFDDNLLDDFAPLAME